MAVSKRLRFEILRRDNHQCRYCGRSAPQVQLVVDHVHPVALGGKDDPANLVTACRDCNSGKTSISPDAPLVANVADDALKWAKAIEMVAQQRREDREEMELRQELFRNEWNRWRAGNLPIDLPPNWKNTIEAVTEAGLAFEDIIALVEVAMLKSGVVVDQRWTYYCGCLWRTVDKIQDQARQLITFGDQWERDMAERDRLNGS